MKSREEVEAFKYILQVAKAPGCAGKYEFPYGTAMGNPFSNIPVNEQYYSEVKLEWVATFDDVKKAKAEAKKIKLEPDTVAILLVKWSCEERREIKTGAWGTLHCALGAKIDEIVAFDERPASVTWGNTMGKIYETIKIGEWLGTKVQLPDNYTVGGGNWLDWTPPKFEVA